jgi:hypothetical protein
MRRLLLLLLLSLSVSLQAQTKITDKTKNWKAYDGYFKYWWDAANGEEVDKLVLNDARPVYKVDDVENRVLYLDKKQLLVFEAKASK